MATDEGIGSGRCGASNGNHRCSFSTWATYPKLLGSLTDMASPSRNVRLSQPPGSTGVIGSLDQCGNCSVISRDTRAASISMVSGDSKRIGRNVAPVDETLAGPRSADARAAGVSRRYTSVMAAPRSEHTLEKVAAALAADPDIRLAIAFGSVPRGQASFASDIDIAVWAASGAVDSDRRTELIRTVALSSGRPVDLIDLRVTGVPLMRSILVEGTVLVNRDPDLMAHLTSRMLADVEDFLPLRERLLSERRRRWLECRRVPKPGRSCI